MRIQKTIREQIEQRNRLNEEIKTWFIEQDVDLEGMDTNDAYICSTEKAIGEPQGDGEICYQICEFEDSFSGTYYWECDNGEYVAMDFWV